MKDLPAAGLFGGAGMCLFYDPIFCPTVKRDPHPVLTLSACV